MAQAADADPHRLALLWLESDLSPDAELLFRGARVAASRLDVRLAERLCRATIAAQPSPVAKLLLTQIVFLQENGEAAREVLDNLGSEESAVPDFLDGVILRAAVLMWPLRKAYQAVTLIEEAITLGDDDRNHSLRTVRAVGHMMAAEPAEAIKAMATVDYDRLDDVGRIVGHTVETIARGDMGCAQEAGLSALAGYRVPAESPRDTIHFTGLAEFHAYALLAAGFVDEAVAVAEREYQRCAEFPGLSQWMALAALGMTAIGKGDLTAALRYFRSASEGFGDTGDIGGVLYRIRIPFTEALARSGDVGAAVPHRGRPHSADTPRGSISNPPTCWPLPGSARRRTAPPKHAKSLPVQLNSHATTASRRARCCACRPRFSSATPRAPTGSLNWPSKSRDRVRRCRPATRMPWPPRTPTAWMRCRVNSRRWEMCWPPPMPLRRLPPCTGETGVLEVRSPPVVGPGYSPSSAGVQ